MRNTAKNQRDKGVTQSADEAYSFKALAPLLSVIIAVYNDWVQLDACLQSLAQQVHAPSFEVIVIDDGGSAPPEPIHRWANHYPFTIIRHTHTGIAGTRNRGIRNARGTVLMFVDADCRLQPDCLAALASAVEGLASADFLSAPACRRLFEFGRQSGNAAPGDASRPAASAGRLYLLFGHSRRRHSARKSQCGTWLV